MPKDRKERRNGLAVAMMPAFICIGWIAPTAAAELPAEVLGVTWEWVSFTTPVEIVSVDAPERYTLQFVGDRASLRADCNRGAGAYTVDADRRIALGPLAFTRAACPPGSLSDRFVKEVGRVTSYFLRDGDLYLELPVDSGTLQFRRQD
ncbi:MAG TPA: META domain-containing protein [Azospirillum sp.]|nr:META domain-containing protein [Azospirillum sp.]